MSTTADAEGQFSLTGTSDDRTQFRATKEDHYTLTFVADSTCTDLPNELRTRTYAATMTPESNSHSPAHTLFSLAREPPTRPCPRRFGATALRRGARLPLWPRAGADSARETAVWRRTAGWSAGGGHRAFPGRVSKGRLIQVWTPDFMASCPKWFSRRPRQVAFTPSLRGGEPDVWLPPVGQWFSLPFSGTRPARPPPPPRGRAGPRGDNTPASRGVGGKVPPAAPTAAPRGGPPGRPDRRALPRRRRSSAIA